jgi:hypothetical protein
MADQRQCVHYETLRGTVPGLATLLDPEEDEVAEAATRFPSSCSSTRQGMIVISAKVEDSISHILDDIHEM